MSWAYFYFMKDESARVRVVAAQHAQYWSQPHSSEHGPFSDRSGGLIVFEAADEKTSEQTVADDPFQREALLEHWWLKAWEPADETR